MPGEGAYATTGTVDDPVFGNLRVAREGRAIVLPEQSTTISYKISTPKFDAC